LSASRPQLTAVFGSPTLASDFWRGAADASIAPPDSDDAAAGERRLNENDPIFAAIRDFEGAWAAYMAATDKDAITTAGEAWQRAVWRLVEVEPSTLKGVVALLHTAQVRWPDGEPVFEAIMHPDDPDSDRSWMQEAIALIEKALTNLRSL
jgi:hypothetical protein